MKRSPKQTKRKTLFGDDGYVTITVTFDPKERERVAKAAANASRSMSNWVRQAVLDKLRGEQT